MGFFLSFDNIFSQFFACRNKPVQEVFTFYPPMYQIAAHPPQSFPWLQCYPNFGILLCKGRIRGNSSMLQKSV